MDNVADVLIVGTGAAGLFCALQLPETQKVVMITKDSVESSDSFLAQGGICMLRSPEDYEAYYEDTMRAGHYQNDPQAVQLMINRSSAIIHKLLDYGVDFRMEGDDFAYTREGAHSQPRILYHDDITGEEITSKLLAAVRARPNVTIHEHTEMVDLILLEDECCGVVAKLTDGTITPFYALDTVLATGGLGGLFAHTTNFAHIAGDGLGIALKHGIPVKDINYIQIHPTTLYTTEAGRSFLISESVRGEGGVLLDKNGERFTDELLPRDKLTAAIEAQKKKDGTDYVRLSMVHLGREEILARFPNIYRKCLEAGYDITKEAIPVTPAQHYFMGGIEVDLDSRTATDHLYAIGETSNNGVHGANRLASNSLLEALVFAERAALSIGAGDMRRELPGEIPFTYDGDEDFSTRIYAEIKEKDPEFYEKWFSV